MEIQVVRAVFDAIQIMAILVPLDELISIMLLDALTLTVWHLLNPKIVNFIANSF